MKLSNSCPNDGLTFCGMPETKAGAAGSGDGSGSGLEKKFL